MPLPPPRKANPTHPNADFSPPVVWSTSSDNALRESTKYSDPIREIRLRDSLGFTKPHSRQEASSLFGPSLNGRSDAEARK